MKIRGLFKKAAATLMAAVTALSILPATTAFAAGDIGTISFLTKQLQAEQGVTEELKAKAPMQWVGLMNNIRSQAEEVILTELIYN